MIRLTMFVIVASVLGSVGAAGGGQPGERISWNDTVVALPGLTPGPFLPPMDPLSCQDDDSLDFLQCARSFPLSRQDAEGNVYAFREMSDRTELWRTRPGGDPELVAQIPLSRPVPGECHDLARFQGFYLDPFSGEVYVRLASGCSGPFPCCSYGDRIEVFRISGLKSAAEVVREQLDLPPGLDRRSR